MLSKIKIIMIICAIFLMVPMVNCSRDRSVNGISNVDCSNDQIDIDHYFGNSKIIFISRRIDDSGAWRLYSMNVDGSNQKCLTEKSVRCAYPSCSSNGLRIAFVHYSENNVYELYTVGIDGGSPHWLASSCRFLGQPSWSPDDSKIIFTSNSNCNSDTTDIYIIDSDGGNHEVLTHTGSNSCPVWSPDGHFIAFASNRDGFSGIYTMKADGTKLKLLTEKDKSFTCPRWSPDGKHIAFVSCNFKGSQIFSMNADGANQKQLTNSVNPNWTDTGFPRQGNHSPVWSPNGSKLAYISWQNGNPDIYIMDLDGSNKRQITDSDQRDEMPFWSPLGDYIIFSSNRKMELDFDIFIMKSNGCNPTPLSNYYREDVNPVWNMR